MNNNKADGYPILDGKVLVKVSLRKQADKKADDFSLLEWMGYRFVNMQVKSYYLPPFPMEPVPVIRFFEKFCASEYDSKMELDLAKDSLSLASQLRSAMGVLVAAGFLIISTLGFSGKSTGSEPARAVNTSARHTRNDTGSNIPEILIQSNLEKQLLTSLVPGVNPGASNRHYFRLSDHINVSHTNLTGSHVNSGQEYPHENLFEPHGDHSNHSDNSHVNHTNIPHVDHSNVIHSDVGHNDHTNNGNVDTHTNDTEGGHHDVHANEGTSHTNIVPGDHTNIGHQNTPGHVDLHDDIHWDGGGYNDGYNDTWSYHNNWPDSHPHSDTAHTDAGP